MQCNTTQRSANAQVGRSRRNGTTPVMRHHRRSDLRDRIGQRQRASGREADVLYSLSATQSSPKRKPTQHVLTYTLSRTTKKQWRECMSKNAIRLSPPSPVPSCCPLYTIHPLRISPLLQFLESSNQTRPPLPQPPCPPPKHPRLQPTDMLQFRRAWHTHIELIKRSLAPRTGSVILGNTYIP